MRSNYCFIQGYNKTLFFIYVIFLRIIPRTWLPLDSAILRCSETFMLAFIVTPKSFSFTVYTADFVGRHRVASQRPLTAVTGLATNQCVGRIGTWANLARSWPRFLKERPISEVRHRLCDPIACMYSVHAWCSCIHSMFSVHASTNIIYCASSTTTDRLMCH